MSYDNRKALPKDYNLNICDENSDKVYSVIIESEIGRGGSCIVYSGIQKDSVGTESVNRSVIIKEFYPKALEDDIIREDDMELQIKDETQRKFEERMAIFCVGQAKHIIFANENARKVLPPVSFSGKANGTFYAISNPGYGTTLSNLNRNTFVLTDALKLTASVCNAISAIHNKSMQLYLDCKPSNIYVFQTCAFLFDFDTVQPKDRLRYCVYSEGWSAPEQIYKDDFSGYWNTRKLGFHTDIFSVGAVFFYLLIGRKPSDDDIAHIQVGFDWCKQISLIDKTEALKNEIFIKELDRVMRAVLQPDADIRKADFGDRGAAIKAKREFEHLAELAENTPYKRGSEDITGKIYETRDSLENIIDKYSRKIIVAIVSLVVFFVMVFGISVLYAGKVNEKINLDQIEVEQEMDEHILLKLTNASFRYKTGLENWRRLDYKRAEQDILASLKDISESVSQQEIDVAKINNSLGCLYLDMGKYGEAYNYLNDALITFRDVFGQNSAEALAVLFSIAQYDYYSGDIDTALKTIQQIIDKTDMTQNKVIAASVLHFQAKIYDELGDYLSAICAYQNVLELYDEILEDGELAKELSDFANDPQLSQNEKDEYTAAVRWIVLTYNNLGETYIHSGNYDEAKYVLEKGLNISLDNKKIGKKELTTSKLYMNLAKLYKQQGDLKEGIESIDLAMRIQLNLFHFEGVYPGLVEVYDIYGDLLMDKNNTDNASQYYSDAVSLAEKSYGRNHPITAEAYNYVGEYYIATENYKEAAPFFETAIEIRRNILSYHHVNTVRYLYNLAIAQKELANTEVAQEVISEAEDLCEELGVEGELRDNVSKLYSELNNICSIFPVGDSDGNIVVAK